MTVDKDDVVAMVPIEVGVTVGDRYLIMKGLEGGERIISEGIIKARPGSKVRVVSSQEKLDAPAKPAEEKQEK